jgi:hypothetical protein
MSVILSVLLLGEPVLLNFSLLVCLQQNLNVIVFKLELFVTSLQVFILPRNPYNLQSLILQRSFELQELSFFAIWIVAFVKVVIDLRGHRSVQQSFSFIFFVGFCQLFGKVFNLYFVMMCLIRTIDFVRRLIPL